MRVLSSDGHSVAQAGIAAAAPLALLSCQLGAWLHLVLR